MPYILFKYISKQFLFYFCSFCVIVASTILLFDVIELLKILYLKNVPFLVILQMALLKNLDHLQRVIPFIGLIASIVMYVKLSNSSEIVVMRSVGLSIWHILLPSVVSIIAVGILNITIINPITVYFLTKYEKAESLYLKGHTSLLALSPTGLWIKQNDEKGEVKGILHALRVAQRDKELYDVTFYNTDATGAFIERIDAKQAVLRGKKWKVYDAVITKEMHDITHQKEMYIPTNLSFNQIQESVIPPKTISFWRLPKFIEIAEKSGLAAVKHKLHFYKIIIMPFFMASLILLGTSFAFSLPRQGNAGKLAIYGFSTGFVIYFISDIIYAYGMSGKIPLILSAFAPTLLCAITGLYLHLAREDL